MNKGFYDYMDDAAAAEVLRKFTSWIQPARGNGKSTTHRKYAEALFRAIMALDRRTPEPVKIKWRIFKERYCPSCMERVKLKQCYCHKCGQALREPSIGDMIKLNPVFIPTSPPIATDDMRNIQWLSKREHRKLHERPY